MASNQRGGRVAASHPPPKRKPLTVSTGWKKNRGGTPTGKERRNYPPHSFPPPCISFSRHAVSITRPIAGPRSPFAATPAIRKSVPVVNRINRFVSARFDSLRCENSPRSSVVRIVEQNNPQHGIALQQTRRASSKFSGRFFPPREKSLEKPSNDRTRREIRKGREKKRVKSQDTRHSYSPGRSGLFSSRIFLLLSFPLFSSFPRDIACRLGPRARRKKEKKRKREGGKGRERSRINPVLFVRSMCDRNLGENLSKIIRKINSEWVYNTLVSFWEISYVLIDFKTLLKLSVSASG